MNLTTEDTESTEKKEVFARCLAEFGKRTRCFGLIDEQLTANYRDSVFSVLSVVKSPRGLSYEALAKEDGAYLLLRAAEAGATEDRQRRGVLTTEDTENTEKKEEFARCLAEFGKRTRCFGLIDEQLTANQ